jgi:hypothetical protein
MKSGPPRRSKRQPRAHGRVAGVLPQGRLRESCPSASARFSRTRFARNPQAHDSAGCVGSGCGVRNRGILAALPNRERVGVAPLPEVAAEARRRHPDLAIEDGDIESLQRGAPLRRRHLQPPFPQRRRHPQPAREAARARERARAALPRHLQLPVGDADADGGDCGFQVACADLELAFAQRLREPVRDRGARKRALRGSHDPAGRRAWLAPLLNRYVGKLPGCQRLSMYRIYALRRQDVLPSRARCRSALSCPAATRRATSQAAIDRTPVLGSRTELIFVEGGSTDGTWETIRRPSRTTAGRSS